MDPHLNPFSVLSWIIAPALLTNACTLLILSTANRLARAVDRAQEHSSKLDEQRSLMLLAALRSFYVACGSFATATLISIFGAVVATLEARDLVRVLEVCGAAAGLVAVGALIHGSVVVMRETTVVVLQLKQRGQGPKV